MTPLENLGVFKTEQQRNNKKNIEKKIFKHFLTLAVIFCPSLLLIVIVSSQSGAANDESALLTISASSDGAASIRVSTPHLKNFDYRIKKENSKDVNCFGILEGEDESLRIAKIVQAYYPKTASADILASESADLTCFEFLSTINLDLQPITTKMERAFPLAFTILVHQEDPEQVFRLIRALHRPQNVICLHLDAKLNNTAYAFYASLAACIPNLRLTTRRFNIVYASVLRLSADLECLKTVAESGVQWKYVINFAGSEFPLRTNSEMIRILRRYEGRNDVEGFVADHLVGRWNQIWRIEEATGMIKKTSSPHSPPPLNLKIVKGSAYFALTRNFVDFILNSDESKLFFDWVKYVYSPDEIFWATLQYNPHLRAPGGSADGPGPKDKSSWRMKFTNWLTKAEPPCRGVVRHAVCVYGLQDLTYLQGLQWFAANKFDINVNRMALECLEELHRNRSFAPQPIDLSAYPLALARP